MTVRRRLERSNNISPCLGADRWGARAVLLLVAAPHGSDLRADAGGVRPFGPYGAATKNNNICPNHGGDRWGPGLTLSFVAAPYSHARREHFREWLL